MIGIERDERGKAVTVIVASWALAGLLGYALWLGVGWVWAGLTGGGQ